MSEVKKKTEETAIVRITRELPAQSISDIASIGEMIARSGMYGVNNPAAGFVVAATCHQEGITLFDYYRTYHTIECKPSMKYDAMLARFRALGGSHRIIERTSDRAIIELNIGTETYTESLSWDEAKKEPYPYKTDGKTLKKNWATPRARRQMLWARVVSEAIRTLRPEIVAGIYTPEETQDFIDVTPEPTEPRRATSSKATEIMNAIESQPETTVIDVTPESISDAAEPDAPCEIPPFPGDDESTAAEEIDYTVCPIPGKKFGVKWTEFSIDHLGTAMNAKHPAMMPGHYQAVARAANEVNRGKQKNQ